MEASRRDLSNAASSVSLRPFVFEIAGEGVGSDPPRLWWVQKQPRRWRVNLRSYFEVDLSRSSCIYFDAPGPWTRETRWYKTNFLPLLHQKLFSKNHFRKYYHFDIDYLWSLTQWPHLKSVDKTLPGFFQGYLIFFLICSIMVFDMLTIAYRNTLNWGKFDVWWPLVTSLLAWEKYDPNSFERTLYELSNIFFRFSLRCLKPPARFRVSWSRPGIGLRHLGISRYVQLIYT